MNVNFDSQCLVSSHYFHELSVINCKYFYFIEQDFLSSNEILGTVVAVAVVVVVVVVVVSVK